MSIKSAATSRKKSPRRSSSILTTSQSLRGSTRSQSSSFSNTFIPEKLNPLNAAHLIRDKMQLTRLKKEDQSRSKRDLERFR